MRLWGFRLRCSSWHFPKLSGFLIGQNFQGQGYGSAATVAALSLAKRLTEELQAPAKGVVLGVNERNHAGRAAYLKAGFRDAGHYLGGRSGPQHIMFHPFVNNG